MKYPIIQITDEQWKALREFDVEYSDNITLLSNRKLKEYFLSTEYIDSNGIVYKVTDFQTTGLLSSVFRYIPLIPFSGKLVFSETNKKLSLEEFRELVLKRIHEVSTYNDFESIVLNAKTYAEIMGDKG